MNLILSIQDVFFRMPPPILARPYNRCNTNSSLLLVRFNPHFAPKSYLLATYSVKILTLVVSFPQQIRRRALTSRRNVVKISNSTVEHDLNL